jgi:hypothetical protein
MNKKTETMIRAAMHRAAAIQDNVVIVADSRESALAVLQRVRELDPAGSEQHGLSRFKLSDGGAVFVASRKSPVVNMRDFMVRGVNSDSVFWDPEAIHTEYAQVFTEYHRYDQPLGS